MALTTDGPVLLSVRDDVAWVELARPPVNALDLELVDALAASALELDALDPRAVVFSGGPRTLAAGGDVKWMLERAEALDRKELRTFLRGIQRLFDDIERLPMPTIAVVRGYTLGGGLELALACDLRVASDDAQIGFPEATLGLLPAAGGTQRLSELVGRGIALELMYTGRRITAAEGRRLGVLNRVCAPEAVDAVTQALLDEVLRATPEALQAIKRCVLANAIDGRGAGSLAESAAAEQLACTPSTVARLQDFQQRRERKSDLQGA